MMTRRIIPIEKRTPRRSPDGEMLVRVRRGVRFAAAICANPEGIRLQTPWCGDRSTLLLMIQARIARGNAILYIVTCRVKEPA